MMCCIYYRNLSEQLSEQCHCWTIIIVARLVTIKLTLAVDQSTPCLPVGCQYVGSVCPKLPATR